MLFEQGKALVWVDDHIDYAVLSGCLLQLTEQHHLQVHFISVVPEKSRLKWLEPIDIDELDHALVDARRQHMERRLRDHNIAFEGACLHVCTGKPAAAVSQFADHGAFDLVIKAADLGHKTSPDDMALLRRCPKPVLLVKSGAAPIERIVAAIDIGDEMNHLFNEQILGQAEASTKALGASLELVSCWSFDYEADLRDSPFYRQKQSKIDAAITHEQSRLEQELVSIGEGRAQRCRLLKGDVVESLSQYVEDNAVDLVVMGTVARSGFQGWVVGNTAEELLPAISCSILAIKPKDLFPG
ncbi:Universal stress protein E [BD1-7 clade bacterium]|uniref:Universal stress protein E n=1 Tax=BD1-7 clade bacterium TaxID=2029982 RepID=A0A5S9MY21_9GAMM|nr:Universal stress protein E [BD1-7 clade bacterium]